MDLITGGAGLVGTHLAEELTRRGRKVRVLDVKRWPSYPPDVEVVLGDVRDKDVVATALRDVQHVYHLSTLIQHDRKPDLIREVIARGGENVVRLATEAGVDRIVVFTTTEVYGHIPNGPASEGDPRVPIDDYGMAKVALEDGLFSLIEHGAPVSIVRPPVIIGPRFQFSPLPRLFKLFRRNLPVPLIGDGSSRVQAVHVFDVVDAAIKLAGHPNGMGEAFNIASGGVISFLELMTGLRDYIGSSSPMLRLPVRPTLKTLRLANKFTSPLFLESGQFEIMGEDYLLDLSKAEKILGWTPAHTQLGAMCDAYDWHLCTHPYPKPNRLKPRAWLGA